MMTAGTGHERRHTGVACARSTRRWARRACLFLVLALCVASTSARKREDKGHDLVRQAKKDAAERARRVRDSPPPAPAGRRLAPIDGAAWLS